jgi:hypothetical protein
VVWYLTFLDAAWVALMRAVKADNFLVFGIWFLTVILGRCTFFLRSVWSPVLLGYRPACGQLLSGFWSLSISLRCYTFFQ